MSWITNPEDMIWIDTDEEEENLTSVDFYNKKINKKGERKNDKSIRLDR